MESAVGFALAVVLHPDVAAHRNPQPPTATLVTASAVPLPGDVDCNSPAVWDVENGAQTLKVVTSAAGQTGVADGARWDRMGDWAPSLLVDPPPGRLWMESVIADEAGTWYGFYHNEIPAMVCGRPELAMPRIGAARSFDQGASWEDLGIVVQQGYGATECGPAASNSEREHPTAVVGRTIDPVRLRLDPADHEFNPVARGGEALAAAGIGQGIEDGKFALRPVPQRVVHEVGADEPGAAGDKDPHVSPLEGVEVGPCYPRPSAAIGADRPV